MIQPRVTTGSVASEVNKSWLIDSWGQTEGVNPFLVNELGSELKRGQVHLI